MKCRLCHAESNKYYVQGERIFYQCVRCRSIQVHHQMLPSASQEKERYGLHQNSSSDSGYVSFLRPLIDVAMKYHSKNDTGLDFGSGPEPVLTELLQHEGYAVEAYDPIFKNDSVLLTEEYDFIICCEVAEHFHDPASEFFKLSKMLKRGGSLFIKTHLFTADVDFPAWWYKNDITHVFFYTSEALEYIKHTYNFSGLQMESNVIRFIK
ncbi:class I SAM-dependent methyltransferase [Saccharicrinis sp. FJH54]|uniref:class I SAM-dependent methyltransferase n=1 Tax=Saccharicrinis sp. FJH54 TaxID=3344665 RepID=UPI0035D4C615